MASALSAETNMLNAVDSLDLSSETETDEQSEETTDSVQRGMQLISKNTKSLMWKYFGFTPDEDGRPTNYCNLKYKLCSKDVAAKFGNTSNLLKHLHLHHRNKFNEISCAQAAEPRPVKSSTQPTLQACFEQSRKHSTNSKENRRLSNVVTNFIVRDIMPIYTVEKDGFRTMVEALNPRYQLPHKDCTSAEQLSQNCMKELGSK